MSADRPQPSGPPARPRRSTALLAVLVLVAVLIGAFVMLRRGSGAAEDCEKKPPPNRFAVAGCDEGAASPGGAAPSTPRP